MAAVAMVHKICEVLGEFLLRFWPLKGGVEMVRLVTTPGSDARRRPLRAAN